MEPGLDDVFGPNHLESLKVVVADGNPSKPKEESTESPRDPAQANGHDKSDEKGQVDVVQTASSVEHLSSALSLLMNSKDPEQGLLSVSPSCPLEDSSLQDFEVIGSCEEVTESAAAAAATATGPNNPTHINYVRSGIRPSLPSPDVLGCGNPFLIFLCLTVLLPAAAALPPAPAPAPAVLSSALPPAGGHGGGYHYFTVCCIVPRD